MNKIFPNVETAVMAIFLICVVLWGASRCKQKKLDAAIQSTTIGTTPLDSVASPAASAPRIPPNKIRSLPADPNAMPQTTINNTSQYPQYQQQPPPVLSSPTTTTLPKPPQSGLTSTPTPSATAVPMPKGGQQNTQQIPNSYNTEPTGSALYVLIGGLNVRSKPDLKAKSLGKLKLDDQVYYMNEVTEQAQAVRLANGTSISKPWFKIKTKRGTIGWVHGSGVDFYKRKAVEGL